MEIVISVREADNGFIIEYCKNGDTVETYVVSESENNFKLENEVLSVLQIASTLITSKLDIPDVKIDLVKEK